MMAPINKAENYQDVERMSKRFWGHLERQVSVSGSQEVSLGLSVMRLGFGGGVALLTSVVLILCAC